MSEAQLFLDLRNGINDGLVPFNLSRIESHAMTPGFPDVDYCIGGVVNQLELKYGKRGKLPEMRTTQVNWFKYQIRAGGFPLFLARLDFEDEPMITMYGGKKAKELYNAHSMERWAELADVVWKGNIVNWVGVRACLMDPKYLY